MVRLLERGGHNSCSPLPYLSFVPWLLPSKGTSLSEVVNNLLVTRSTGQFTGTLSRGTPSSSVLSSTSWVRAVFSRLYPEFSSPTPPLCISSLGDLFHVSGVFTCPCFSLTSRRTAPWMSHVLLKPILPELEVITLPHPHTPDPGPSSCAVSFCEGCTPPLFNSQVINLSVSIDTAVSKSCCMASYVVTCAHLLPLHHTHQPSSFLHHHPPSSGFLHWLPTLLRESWGSSAPASRENL